MMKIKEHNLKSKKEIDEYIKQFCKEYGFKKKKIVSIGFGEWKNYTNWLCRNSKEGEITMERINKIKNFIRLVKMINIYDININELLTDAINNRIDLILEDKNKQNGR